jgi:hypothetical protein
VAFEQHLRSIGKWSRSNTRRKTSWFNAIPDGSFLLNRFIYAILAETGCQLRIRKAGRARQLPVKDISFG